MNQNGKILVTGASGRLGQLVLEALLKAGQKNVIGTTRDPEKLTKFAQQGVEIRNADFSDTKSLDVAFAGATRLLMISTMDIGRRVSQHKNAIEAAKRAGVNYILYTSWLNPETSTVAVAPDHAETERLVKACGLKYVILRNNFYAENLLFSLPTALQSGSLYGCAGSGKASYILREDCAKAAAGALIYAEKFANNVFDLTGPETYSYSEIVDMINASSPKKIKYVDLTAEDFKAASIKSGVPEAYAQLFASMDEGIKNGEASLVTNMVEKLSGKPARSIRKLVEGISQK